MEQTHPLTGSSAASARSVRPFRFGVVAASARTADEWLTGSTERMCDELLERRARFGISYVLVSGASTTQSRVSGS